MTDNSMNVLTNVNTVTDTAKTASAQSYANSDTNFNDILDNANNNYIPKETGDSEKQVTSQKQTENGTQKSDKKEIKDSKDQKTSNEKTDGNDASKSNSDKKTDAPKIDKNTETNAVTAETEKATNTSETDVTKSEINNLATNFQQPESAVPIALLSQLAAQASANPQTTTPVLNANTNVSESQIKTDDANKTDANKTGSTASKKDDSTLTAKTAETVTLDSSALLAATTDAITTNVSQNSAGTIESVGNNSSEGTLENAKAKNTAETTASTPQTTLQDETINVLFNNVAKTTNENQNNPKIQTKTQQVLANINIDENGGSQIAQSAQNANDKTTMQTVTNGGIEIFSNQDIQEPVIQVTTEKIAVSVNKGEQKDTTKNTEGRSSISQNLIQDTKAKVTSVETNSNTNEFSAQTDAREQSLKLSVEANSKGIGAAAGLVDTTSQTAFDNTLNNVQQTQSATQTRTLTDSEIISQIHNKLSQLQEQSTTKITIVLNPENLGKINLELVNGKDGLTASLTAENAQVKEILDKNLDSLKNNLSNQGVNVNNVTVKIEDASKQSSGNSLSSNQEQNGGENQQFGKNSKNEQGGGRGYVSYDESGEIAEAPEKELSYAG